MAVRVIGRLLLNTDLNPTRWTRREEADFYRVVSTFGVVFDTKLQKFDWSQFRAFARLDKKTDESLEKYYYSFIAMCKRVCRMQAKAETGKRRRRLSASPSIFPLHWCLLLLHPL